MGAAVTLIHWISPVPFTMPIETFSMKLCSFRALIGGNSSGGIGVPSGLITCHSLPVIVLFSCSSREVPRSRWASLLVITMRPCSSVIVMPRGNDRKSTSSCRGRTRPPPGPAGAFECAESSFSSSAMRLRASSSSLVSRVVAFFGRFIRVHLPSGFTYGL